MDDNFTYLRFKQMIMTTYIIDYGMSSDDRLLIKHLDLLRIRFDPNEFTHETLSEYRTYLFSQLQIDLDKWNGDRSMRAGTE